MLIIFSFWFSIIWKCNVTTPVVHPLSSIKNKWIQYGALSEKYGLINKKIYTKIELRTSSCLVNKNNRYRQAVKNTELFLLRTLSNWIGKFSLKFITLKCFTHKTNCHHYLFCNLFSVIQGASRVLGLLNTQRVTN